MDVQRPGRYHATMPKNPAVEILRRWHAMDRALMSPSSGLNLARFADQWGVSVKTVRRDLEAFRELGQQMTCERDEGGRYCWFYEGGLARLFNPEWEPPDPEEND